MLGWLIGILGLGGATTAAAIVFPPFGALLALAGKAAVGWLSKRSLGEIVGIVLAVLLAIDHLALLAAHRENAKLETQLARANKATADANAQLARQAALSRVQQAATAKTVTKVIEGQTQIRTVVEHIHDAPNPPNCATPDLPELANAV